MSEQEKAFMPIDSCCAQLLSVLRGEQRQPVPIVACADIMPRGDLERDLRNSGLGLYSADVNMYRNEWPGIRFGSSMVDGISYQSRITDAGTLTRSVRTDGSRAEACALFYGSVTYVRNVALDGWCKSAEDILAAIAYVDAETFISDHVCYEHARYDYGYDSLLATRGVNSPLDVAQKLLGNNPALTRQLWQQLWQETPGAMEALMAAVIRREERRLASMRGCQADMVLVKGLSTPPTSDLDLRLMHDYELPFLTRACQAYHEDGHVVAIDVSGVTLDRVATDGDSGIDHIPTLGVSQIVDLYQGLGVDIAYGVAPDADGHIDCAPYARLGDDIVLWVSVPKSVLQQGPDRTTRYLTNVLHAVDDAPIIIDLWDCGMSRTLHVSERNALGESVAAALRAVAPVT